MSALAADEASTAQRTLAGVLLSMRPDLSAATLETVTATEAARTLSQQPAIVAARVLDHMLPQQAAPVIVALGERTQEVLSRMSSPRTVGALRWLGDAQRQAILDAVEGALGRELRESLAYPANTAASLMDPQVYSARLSDTVGQALEHIKGVRKPLHQIYVVDSEQLLVGVVPIQDLAVAPAEQRLEALVTPHADAVDAFADLDDVAELLASTATPTIAVIDSEGRLIGALRHRALLGIAEEDAAAMMQQMVGASPDERALSPVRLAVKKRLPWLNINLLTAFIAAAVVGLFESTIAQVTSLAILLPVVAGQSGNSGSQALAVTMRGLALREIRAVHWPRVAAKEVLVGLSMALLSRACAPWRSSCGAARRSWRASSRFRWSCRWRQRASPGHRFPSF